MAQAIFKQWFVDYEFPNENGEPYISSGGKMVASELGKIPNGWEVKKIKQIIKFVKTSTKPGEHLKDRKYVPINLMTKKSVVFKHYESYKEAKSSLLLFNKFDILIGAMRVYFHRVNLSPFKGVTRTTTFVLRSKNNIDIAYNLFLLNLDDTIKYAEKTSKGTTMPYAVWENRLGEMKVVHPSKELRKKFNRKIFKMLRKILLHFKENKSLKKTRDTLLPKLMSGEIRVPLKKEETQ